jgi:uncharacterized damage-inducible protein DinB
VSQVAIEPLIYLMGDAFETLMATIRTLDEDDWDWQPPRGYRTIAGLVGHIAGGKHMNADHTFGQGKLSWEDPVMSRQRSVPELIDWLREGQRRLMDHCSALDDEGLLQKRMMHWGRERETRWFIGQLITHDLFHAGEINHIRALHHQDDFWEWENAAGTQT